MTLHQVVLDVAIHTVEVNSPFCGNFTLILPSRDSTQSCAFSMTELPLKKTPVVCDYADVFPNELPGMPLDRDIEFAIECNRERHLFPRGLTGCHPLNWQN